MKKSISAVTPKLSALIVAFVLLAKSPLSTVTLKSFASIVEEFLLKNWFPAVTLKLSALIVESASLKKSTSAVTLKLSALIVAFVLLAKLPLSTVTLKLSVEKLIL